MSIQFATYPSLTDRVVLISGGASGIGADMVRAFASNGARVGFLDVQDEPAEALVRELGGAAGQAPLYLHCDVTDVDALQASVEGVRARLGPVAVLVNNAADDQRHPVDAVTAEYWDRSFDVNLRHHFFAAQAVHPHMKELGFGSIINFSSISWRFGADQMVAYATAKGAVVALTRALARSFGPDNIRVNASRTGRRHHRAAARAVVQDAGRNRSDGAATIDPPRPAWAKRLHGPCSSLRRMTAA